MKERMETLEEKVARVVQEEVAVVPYDPRWPAMFMEERRHLLSCLPQDVVRRIEHFGSTAVPGLAAKPIVDMLIEVTSLDATQQRIAPILQAQGYDYFWRPSWGEDTPPFYAWFIKRDQAGHRTHHLHMVEAHFEHWDRLLFRDYLRDQAKAHYRKDQPAVAGYASQVRPSGTAPLGGGAVDVVRLGPADAGEFQRLRLAGLHESPLGFRSSPEDEAGRSESEAAARTMTSSLPGKAARSASFPVR